jgi:hypothetical protein
MYRLTEKEEFLCTIIVDCAYKVHKQLGPGLLEKIYEACFCYELKKYGIPCINKIWEAQIISHLKLTQLHVGFVINFNVALIKDGIRRYCVE